ncbi:MAG TPA: flagellar biosynthetic protein FliR [Gemmatimonadaceae bacterium]|nr:flagellar biosynthetic protein FliR [Gemmatimonadaceae bacterium]
MTAGFDPLAPGSAATFMLCATRVSGVIAIAPVFSSTVIPRLVRVAILVVITVLLQPAAYATLHAAPALTPRAFVGEALIGLAIGLGAAIIVGAAEMAGDTMAVQMGLSGSAILDPLDTQQLPVLGIFTRLFTVALLLSLDLHTVMLGALSDSFQTLPPGSPVSAANGLAAMVQLGSRLFMLGIRFAAPVIAAVLITNLAMAILGRAAQQLNLLTVSFPVQIAIGLFAFAAAVPSMARTLTGWTVMYRDMIDHVGAAFAAAAR